jgi:hypothetical protein
MNDPLHCGACNAPCPADFGCYEGRCRRAQPLGCDDLVVDLPVWGYPARGFDLRPYTSSTLHWIGCAVDGCVPSDFYCEQTPTTLLFGTRDSLLRTLVDPDDALGDAFPEHVAGCADSNAPHDKHNAPTGASDLPGISSIDALCWALGYSSGSLVRELVNFCPEPYALDPDGLEWGSSLEGSSGAGAEYVCVLDDAEP